MKQIYDNKDIGEMIDKSFDAGIKEGYHRCMEQMMKEAVDGEISQANDGWKSLKLPSTFFGEISKKYNFGDKVHVIVLPKED